MNKSDLISNIAKQSAISKSAAKRSLEAIVAGVKTALKKEGRITIAGLGTFSTRKRAARIGRNPRTGESIKIKATKVTKFKPGKALKEALK